MWAGPLTFRWRVIKMYERGAVYPVHDFLFLIVFGINRDWLLMFGLHRWPFFFSSALLVLQVLHKNQVRDRRRIVTGRD